MFSQTAQRAVFPGQRQRRIVVWVTAFKAMSPTFPHGAFILPDGVGFAADTFVMNQFAVRCPDIALASFQAAQTQINIVSNNCQIFIELSQ